MKKLLAITLVAVMCMTSFVLLYSEDAEAEASTGKIHPYTRGMYVECSTVSREYSGSGYSYEFDKSYYYYTTNPMEIAKKLANRETDNFGDYVDKDHLQSGISYWAIMIGYGGGGGTSGWGWKSLSVKMETIYLPSGSYKIEFTSNNMKSTSSHVEDMGNTLPYVEFSDGRGSVSVAMSRPSSYYVSTNYKGSEQITNNDRFNWVMEYKITPAPPELKDVTCEDTINVGTDKAWVKYESTDRMSAGEYSLNYSDEYYIFPRGSTLETNFVNDVVNKGSSDTSGYVSNTFTLTSTSYVNMYCIDDENGNYGYTKMFNFQKKTESGWNYVDCRFTSTVVGEPSHYTFYAGQDFSIGVDYDTADFDYVVLKTASTRVLMKPGKLYVIKAVTAGEYEIYGILAEGSTVNLKETPIKVHMEDVPVADSNGMLFAAVSIGFCAIAFFLLFFFGRRPKWDEMTGLPVSGGVEEVVNEVPDEAVSEAPQEIPEETAEKPPEE